MSLKKQNTLVGIFVLVGIAVMAGLVVAFGGGRTLFANTYNLNVEFPDGVMSVQPGQTVTLGGKRIGETTDVLFVDQAALEKGVIVVVSVEGYELPTACEMLVTPSLLGLGKPPIQLLVMDPRDPNKLPMDGTARIRGRMEAIRDQVIPPETLAALNKTTSHIGELAAALKPAAENLNRLLEQRYMSDVDAQSITANMDVLIQRFDSVLKSVNAVIGDEANQANFKSLLANTKTMSESGIAAMENIRQITDDGKAVTKDVGELARRLAAASDDLSALIKRMDETFALANQKSGTVGLMLNDNRLYEEMLLTFRRMTKMLDDMREVLDLAKKGQLRIRAL